MWGGELRALARGRGRCARLRGHGRVLLVRLCGAAQRFCRLLERRPVHAHQIGAAAAHLAAELAELFQLTRTEAGEHLAAAVQRPREDLIEHLVAFRRSSTWITRRSRWSG